MKPIFHITAVGLLLLLAACATPQPAPVGDAPGSAPAKSGPAGTTSRAAPPVNLSGFPPAFKDGFSDGCESLRGNYRRDPARFGKDNDYTLGWQDGYSICARQKR